MIAGLSMHHPASVVGGAHHLPPTLDYNNSHNNHNNSNSNGSTEQEHASAESALGYAEADDGTGYYQQQQQLHHHYESAAAPPMAHAAAMNGTTAAAAAVVHHHHHQLYAPQPEGLMEQQQHAQLHPGMMGLEQQFAHFGIQQQLQQHEGGSDQLAHSTHNDSSENNDTEHNEGEDLEEEPVKLFVGQIPKAMNEEDIFPTFDSFGPLKDVAVIRDKHTGIHRGCAFVTYWAAADAERARESLHDKFTFPGAKRAAQVKPAEPSSVPENKLFVGMLSRECDEQQVRDLFSQYGEIHEVYMIRNVDGSSKCAAFLRFAVRESAVHAIEQLNGIEVMEGAQRPLIVKFADNKLQRQQRHIRNIRRHEMMAMVGPGGYPYPPQGPPIAMGMHHPGTAGPQYPMPPAPLPQAYGATAYGPGAQQQQQAPPHHNPYMYPSPYGQVPPVYAYQQPQPQRQETRPANPRPREGPAGANLFVYHLPHDLTDADLATAFNPFGNVISAKVYVDKFTGESKGFGFVSYDSVMAAEQAIEQMNGFQIGNKRLKVQHKRVHGSHHHSPHLEPQSPPSSENNSTTGLPAVASG